MTFIRSGDTITQSGTDSNLTGLAAITGVTTISNSGGTGALTIYDIGSLQLVVTGTLTFNPYVESLLISDGAPRSKVEVLSGGILNIGQASTLNGVLRYPSGLAIHSLEDQSSFQEDQGTLRIANGGTLNWFGGDIVTKSSVAFEEGSTVRIYSEQCRLIVPGLSTNGQVAQLRCRNTNLTIDALYLDRGEITLIENPTLLNNIKSIHSNQVFQLSSSTPDNIFITVSNYNSEGGNTLDFAVKDSRWFRVINSSAGSNLEISDQGSGDLAGLVELRQIVRFTANDLDNLPLSDWGVYANDIDHGNRLAANLINSNPNYLNDREYADMEAGSGEVLIDTDGGILTAVWYKELSGPPTFDYRGNTNSNSDIFTYRIRKYGYLFTTANIVHKGLGGNDLSVTLFNNLNINQSEAIASSHTGISIVEGTFSLFSKIFSIKIIGDLSVNSSLTIQDIYHYLQYHLSQTNVLFNGRLGGAWGELLRTTNGQEYNTVIGTYGGDAVSLGVCVVDENDVEFPGVTSMQADDGTFFTPVIPVIVDASVLADSRVQLYNVTQDSELDNVFITGTSYQYTVSAGVSSGDTLRLRVTKKGYVGVETFALYSENNISFLVNQEVDAVYDSYGIDGDTVTKFTPDYNNNEVDLVVATNFGAAEAYAWYNAELASEDGIRFFFGGVTPIDAGNLQINTSVINLFLDNTTAVNIFQDDNIRIFRADGQYPIKNPTSGGGGIDVVWRTQVFTVEATTLVSTQDKEDIAALIKPDMIIINDGLKKASLLIPHSQDLD